MHVRLTGAALACCLVLAATPAWADPTPECNAAPAPGSTECGADTIASAEASTAVGAEAQATGPGGAQAFGWQTRSSGLRSLAAGYQAQATNNFAVAAGPGTVASGLNSSAIGPFANANGMGATALGNGARATAAGTFSGGVLSTASGMFSTALGRQTQATGLASTALGNLAIAGGDNATALGTGASAAFANTTALGANATATVAGQVALGGAGTHVRIGDIGASTAAQDVASVGLATVDAAGVLGRDTTLMPAIGTLGAAQARMSGQIDELFDLRRLDRRDMRQGIAAAVAMGQAPMPSAAGRTAYVVNGATFRGEFAVGGSFLHRLDTEVPLALGVGFSFAGNKNNAFKAGVAGEF